MKMSRFYISNIIKNNMLLEFSKLANLVSIHMHFNKSKKDKQ